MSQVLSALGKSLVMEAVQQFYTRLAYWGAKVPAAHPSRHGVEVLRDIAYVDGSREPHHRLDLYRPSERDEPLPIVFYVHGGGFRILSKDTHWIFGLGFARAGYLVFNINYRLAPQHPFPAGPMDMCQAYTWVTENAHRFGGDPKRIILAGESAGANLVTALAIATSSERPEPWAKDLIYAPAPIAVMPCCGLHQVSDVGRFARRRKLARAVTVQLEQVGRDYLGDLAQHEAELADPLLVLERGLQMTRPLPPFLSTVGTRDPILDDTRRLAAALLALDVPCETRYYQGQGHAFHALIWREEAKSWWRHSLQFMASLKSETATTQYGGL